MVLIDAKKIKMPDKDKDIQGYKVWVESAFKTFANLAKRKSDLNTYLYKKDCKWRDMYQDELERLRSGKDPSPRMLRRYQDYVQLKRDQEVSE